MKSPDTEIKYSFFKGSGEMASLMRAFNWEKTSVGAPERWPQSLKTIVRVILSSKFPMFLWWGNDLVQFYNDAYRPSLGNEGKHPSALGGKGQDTWPEIWPVIKPLIDQVLGGGEATWNEDQLIPIYRNGKLDDVYWTFCYSPVYDDSDQVYGVLVTCSETTEKIVNLNSLLQSKAELEFAFEAAELGVWDLDPVTGKFSANARLKEWFGLGPQEEIPLSMAIESIQEVDRKRVTDAIENALKIESGGRYDIEYVIFPASATRRRIVKAKGQARFGNNGIAYRFNGTLQDITTEKEALSEQISAARKADIAVRNSGIGIFTIHIADGKMEYTPEFAFILTGDKSKPGLDRNAFVGYIHPDDQWLREAASVAVQKTGEFDYEVRTIWDDNTVRSIRIMGGMIKNEMEQAILFSGSILDVTQQVLDKKRLEESEQFSRTIFYNSPVAKLVYTGPDMILREANEKMLEIFGRGSSIIGKPLLEAIPELSGTELPARYRKVLQTGETHYQFGERIKLVKYGNPYWGYYDYIYKPLYSTGGKVYGVICTAIEVTETVEATHRLEEAEASLRAAVELAKLGTWSIDVATRKLSLSHRLIEWFGQDPNAQDYDQVLPAIEEMDRNRVISSIEGALGGNFDGNFDEVYSVVNPVTGVRRILHAQGRTVFDQSGKSLRMDGTAQDITLERETQTALELLVQHRTEELAAANEELMAMNEELSAANDKLSASNEELAQYAYVASHDLQEPLRKILIYSELIQKSDLLSQDFQLTASKISKSAKRMSLLIKDLLEFSRLLRSDLFVMPVDLNEVISSVLDDFELTIAENRALITVDKIPTVSAVALQMNQLFYNLISNALKFRRQTVPVKIHIAQQPISFEEVEKFTPKADRSHKYYHITIADNGIGFEKQYADQIFEVFRRLHGNDTYAGTGIGLSICRKVAHNHGGVLFAESTPGAGSVFHLILHD